MRNGQKAETAERRGRSCKKLSKEKRTIAASLAWTFCELTDCQAVWRPVLGPFPMNESTFLREARNGARMEQQRDMLLLALRAAAKSSG